MKTTGGTRWQAQYLSSLLAAVAQLLVFREHSTVASAAETPEMHQCLRTLR